MFLIYFITALIFLFVVPILGRLNFISKEYYHSIILIKDFFTYKNYLFWVLIFPFALWFVSLFFYLWNPILVNNIWFVSFIFWILLFIYITIILQRGTLLVKIHFFTTALLSIMVTFIFNYTFYTKGLEFLLPSQNWWFWVATFFFIISSITNRHKISMVNNSDELISCYIEERRQSFEKKYNNPINGLRNFEKNILIAMLIVEDYNRPLLLRVFERWLSYFNLTKTTGIAQINKKGLSDPESVKLLRDEIEVFFEKNDNLNLDKAQEFFIKINGQNYNKMVLAVLENLTLIKTS